MVYFYESYSSIIYHYILSIKEINNKFMIKSSFKKVEKNVSGQKCFFGHPELDAVLNNSLSKGHLMVLEEDHPSTNYLSLLRYFVSHHYNDKQTIIIYDVGYKWRHLVSPPIKKEDKQLPK